VKITPILKHYLLEIIVMIWSFLKILGIVDNRRLLYLDQSRFGHLVGDTLVFMVTHVKNDFILPVWKPASKYFVKCIEKKITVSHSKFLVYMAGILRNTKHVYDCSNILNSYIDEVYPVSILKKNKFNLNELNTSKIKTIVEEIILDENVLEKYNLKNDKFICFNLRTGYMTEYTEDMHGFRSSDPEDVAELLSYLKTMNIKIINLSNIKLNGLINITYEACYLPSDLFTLIAKSIIYIGDSSGPLIYAQLIGKETFGYNIYPLYLLPTKNSYFNYMRIEEYDQSKDYYHNRFLLKKHNIAIQKNKLDLNTFIKFWNQL